MNQKELIKKIIKKSAKDWVEVAGVKEKENVMIIFDFHEGAEQLAQEVARLCAKRGARVWYRLRDLSIERHLFTHFSRKEIERYYAFLNLEIYEADTVFMIRALENPYVLQDVPSEKLKYVMEAQEPVYLRYRVNHTNWQLIYWPTKFEAKVEGLSYNEYLELYYKAISPDWKKVKEANRKIIEVLDKGKELILRANPNDPDPSKRTEIQMSIEGMTFINSTINRNYPGSEVYSSPVKDSVEGYLYADGEYMLGKSFKKVKNFWFKIEKGKIIDAGAEEGEKDLHDFLNTDEGARYFGEVALGTNPGIRRRVFNPLLNEKVGGSFHITPGNAYEDHEDDDGNVKHVDNGNRSKIHWDITIMMLPQYGGGEVIVDGKTIQKDGRFLIEGTEVLNEGLKKIK